MITNNQIIPIGYCAKTHGIKGELNVVITQYCNLEQFSCVIIQVEGILVPFYIESVRPRNSEIFLVKFQGINTDEDALELVNHSIFALKEGLEIDDSKEDDIVYFEDLVGFDIIVDSNKKIGQIIDYDDSTDNMLFIVKNKANDELLIPATEDFVVEIDINKKYILMLLPEGLINL